MLPSRAELDFFLFDWLNAEALCQRPRYAHLDRDALDAILAAARQLALQHFAPHAARSDEQEPRMVDGRVQLIPEIAAALEAYRDAGFFADEAALAEGGLQLPQLLRSAGGVLFSAANIATGAYPFLTKAAANLIRTCGNAEQRARWLPPMVEGRWFGTMCLSEPHAGSSLGDLRTRAEPLDAAAGSYAIHGSKMWISTGAHELSENIVHLLLARIPGGPAGTRGLSLFIVPRRRVDAQGGLGGDNGVSLIGLNHKMGYRGSVNCLLGFGQDGECLGELLGEPHAGMRLMFQMMNEARIGVGVGAAALGYAGFALALQYARERTQGRSPERPDPATPMRPIVEHADVRRMLLRAKALSEGALALCLYAARLVDEQHTGGDPEAGALLDLLTPVVKAWPSDYGLAANDLAIQVLGGAGYTRDFPLERLYRDNRLNPIHEGTNGIQAIDLLGRKLLADQGRALGLLLQRIEATLSQSRSHEALAPLAAAVQPWLAELTQCVEALAAIAAREGLEAALANASLFLDAFGHVVVAWLWLEQAGVACRGLQAPGVGDARRRLLQGKLQAARYFIAWELEGKRHALQLVARGDRTVLDASADCL
jgi:alkylation response protein AidB-like acyl-CoA dehydrogenase